MARVARQIASDRASSQAPSIRRGRAAVEFKRSPSRQRNRLLVRASARQATKTIKLGTGVALMQQGDAIQKAKGLWLGEHSAEPAQLRAAGPLPW